MWDSGTPVWGAFQTQILSLAQSQSLEWDLGATPLEGRLRNHCIWPSKHATLPQGSSAEQVIMSTKMKDGIERKKK